MVVWRDQAEHAVESLSKGSWVVVVGQLQHRSWTSEDGSARSVVEVVAEELGSEPAMGDGDDDQDDEEPGPVASSTSDATVRDAGGVLAFLSVQQSNHCVGEEFLYELKAGPAGGRLRRPSSAGSHSAEVACSGAGAERQQEFEVSRPAAIGEAAAVFHALITAHGLRVEELTARSAWQVFGDFGRVVFETPDLPDADGLLYQYGMHRLRRPLFELDLVRQFEVLDAEGDHDHYVQMHCTLRYSPTPELAALGADHCWWFPDQGALAAWLHSVATRPEWAVLDAQKPKQVAVHQEDI